MGFMDACAAIGHTRVPLEGKLGTTPNVALITAAILPPVLMTADELCVGLASTDSPCLKQMHWFA